MSVQSYDTYREGLILYSYTVPSGSLLILVQGEKK